MLKSVKELKEALVALHTKALALVNFAKKEDRDLTDEETVTFDELTAQSTEIKEKSLPRAEWLETEGERLREPEPAGVSPVGLQNVPPGEHFPTPRIVLPQNSLASVKRLKAFSGEDAMENAYIAGQFYGAHVYKRRECRNWCEKHDIRGALSTDSAEDGGVLVPVQVSSTIIDLVELFTTFRPNAEFQPMISDIWTGPRVTNGVTAVYVQENASITESQPEFDEIQLIARKLGAFVPLSNELNDDSMIVMGDLITRKIAQAFAAAEDQAGWLGDGSSTYGSFVGVITKMTAATASIVTAATANTAFGTLDLTDFEAMIGKLPEFPGINPKWFISKPGWAASMMRLADAAGGNTASIIEGRRVLSFLGYEVELVQPMNKVLTAQTSTNGLCYFGDLAMAAKFGSRKEIDVKQSEHFKFQTDQLVIRGIERFAINVHDVGDTSVAGPLIMLSTPSS